MNKTILAVSLLAASVLSTSAMAVNTIDFEGTVIASTCDINAAGSGAADGLVTLPAVSTNDLITDGDWAKRTPFDIKLTNCTPSIAQATTFFEPGANIDVARGNMTLTGAGTAGVADNVQLQLLNALDFSEIKLGSDATAQNSTPVTLAAGAATLPYYVQYYATGASTAGSANSFVKYTMTYQ